MGGRKGIRPVENGSELQTFIWPVIGKYSRANCFTNGHPITERGTTHYTGDVDTGIFHVRVLPLDGLLVSAS